MPVLRGTCLACHPIGEYADLDLFRCLVAGPRQGVAQDRGGCGGGHSGHKLFSTHFIHGTVLLKGLGGKSF